MQGLKDKIEVALAETRLLILGLQVLIGLDYRSIFEPGFQKLSFGIQEMKIVGLLLLLVSTALIFAPAPYHRIVERGENTFAFHRFVTRMAEFALLPLALALGIDLFTAAYSIAGQAAAWSVGIAGAGMALSLWYAWELVARKNKEAGSDMNSKAEENEKPTELKDKVKNALVEDRMVLPGAQTLLGFQFAVILVEGFQKLAPYLKYIHLASLCLIAISIILLIAPAAYHRMVEQGEATEHFYRMASFVLLISLVPLAMGMCGDLFVVVMQITHKLWIAVTVSGLMLSLFLGVWFGYSYYRRIKKSALSRTHNVLSFSRTS